MDLRGAVAVVAGSGVLLASVLVWLETGSPPPGKSKFDAVSWTLLLIHLVAFVGVPAGVLLLVKGARSHGRSVWGWSVSGLLVGCLGLVAWLPVGLVFLFFASEGCSEPSTSSRLLYPLPPATVVVSDAPLQEGRELRIAPRDGSARHLMAQVLAEYSGRGWKLERLGGTHDRDRWIGYHRGWQLEVEHLAGQIAVRHARVWDGSCH